MRILLNTGKVLIIKTTQEKRKEKIQQAKLLNRKPLKKLIKKYV